MLNLVPAATMEATSREKVVTCGPAARTQQSGRWPCPQVREGAHGASSLLRELLLNGAPAAASPQVNEFWVDRRLSAHPLHREEALGGGGEGAATQSWVEGGGGRRPARGPVGVRPSPRGRPQDGPWPLCLSVPGIPGAPAGRASCPVWATSA